MTILCVGVACLDIMHVCDSYPVEDSKTRSVDLCWRRGGNASNSCTVLSLMGARCEFLGTIGTKTGSFMVDDMRAHGISMEHCIVHSDHEPVTATVVISKDTGTRTAIFCTGALPELTLDDFQRLDLSRYSWVHFEGRNVAAVAGMMAHATRWNVRVSIELEVPSHLDNMFAVSALADVVFVGKEFARFKGWQDAWHTLQAMLEHVKPGATVIVPWGECGAMAREPGGSVVQSPAFPPERVVDTCAAGDTFIAATIYALDSGLSLHDSITLGCRIAGAKVGSYGLSHIKDVYNKLCVST